MNRYLLMAKLAILRNGYKRAGYLKRIDYFHRQGEGCFFQPYSFGTEPRLIGFGSNVYLASGVRFLTHDVIALMMRTKLGRDDINERVGTISIGDNVFIGADTTVLYDVSIGNDVVVAAGSLVTKDIPDNSVCAGRPAKVIGLFDEYLERMLNYSASVPWRQWEQTREEVAKIQESFLWSQQGAKLFARVSREGKDGRAHG